MHASSSFADRIVNIAIAGTLVRIELGTLVLPTGEGSAPTLTPSQTLVMPIDGFLASFGAMESLVRKLVADGVVKPKPQAPVGLQKRSPRNK